MFRAATITGKSGKISEFHFQSGNIRKIRRIFPIIRENQESFNFPIVSFSRGEFLYAESHIQLSVKIAKISPFCTSFCSVQAL